MVHKVLCLWIALGIASSGLALDVSQWNAPISKHLWSFFQEHHTKPVVVINAEGILWPSDILTRFMRFLDTQESIKTKLARQPASAPEGLFPTYEKQCATTDESCLRWVTRLMTGLSERVVFGWAIQFWTHTTNKPYYSEIAKLVTSLESSGFVVWVISIAPKWVAEVGANLGYKINPSQVLSVHPLTTDSLMITDRLRYAVPYRTQKIFLIHQFIQKRPLIVLGHNYLDYAALTSATHTSLVINPPQAETDPWNRPFIETATMMGWFIQNFPKPQY